MNGTPNTGDPTWPAGQAIPRRGRLPGQQLQVEWQAKGHLDSSTAANSKIGMDDLRSRQSPSDLDHIYLWNVREYDPKAIEDLQRFYDLAETCPRVAPAHGPAGSTADDYDFANNNWTKVNTAADDDFRNLAGQPGRQPRRHDRLNTLPSKSSRAAATDTQVGLAEVAITPEPATMALLAIGGLMVLRRQASPRVSHLSTNLETPVARRKTGGCLRPSPAPAAELQEVTAFCPVLPATRR